MRPAIKSLSVLFVLVVSCAAQKVTLSSASAPEVVSSNVQPMIIQRAGHGAQVVESPSRGTAQVSGASFHMASDQEIQGMEQALEQYVAAFDSLDLTQVRNVWPDLDRQHESAFKNVFASLKSASMKPRLGLQCSVPRIADETANLQCMETVTYAADKGRPKQSGPAHVSIQLLGQADHWVLRDMKGH